MSVILILAWLATSALVLATAYRAIFASAYLFPAGGTAGAPHCASRLRRFMVVIPAHNEELLISDVIGSIRAADYPQEKISIVVIADNCGDNTAARVRALRETVYERMDPINHGKGQALSWLFQRLDLNNVDAVALFDADNLVAPNFLRIANGELDRGARCIQGYYDIANPDESVMTRMLAVTYVMKNLLYNAGKARLGLSVLLMGTGMVFTRDVIERYSWRAMTIGEDYEQTFNLVGAGERIRFLSEARTRAQESSTLRQGYTQRQRWMSGRRLLASRAFAALGSGIRHGSWTQIDTALDIFMPPYSTMLTSSLLCAALAYFLLPWGSALTFMLLVVVGYQVVEVCVGLILMRASIRHIAAIAFAPIFLLWRAGIDILAVFGHRSDRWARTRRTNHASEQALDPPREDR